MPRPTTKTELLAAATDGWDKLWKLIDSMPGGAEAVAFDFGDEPKFKEAHWKRDHNLRDVLIHLHEWHNLLLNWVASNQSGTRTPFLPPPYTWKTYGEMNVGFWEKHRATPYEQAVARLKESHAKVMALIAAQSPEELFIKGSLPWTGSTTLGAYCISATSGHYDWAMKKLRLYRKGNAGAPPQTLLNPPRPPVAVGDPGGLRP
ncbi:MAG: ClbS/DfsB family four-helix bundle protein [Oscillospiraceae bacterium]|jgi:hypothetical protein|nr:ClbS/DfsB family four-helix bundle protein [Oscillospiraceae bacterium]